MNVADVRVDFAYNRWANRRLLEAVAELPTEDFERDLRGSFASIAGTLRHLVWGERSWLQFWRQGSFEADLTPGDMPDLPSIVAAWSALEEEEAAFARELDQARLDAPCPVEEDPYVLGELVRHAINHATHHRGQVVLMLRQLGRTPPGTGFRQFLTETRGRN